MQTNFAPRLIISALFFVVVAAQGQEPLFNQRNATGDPHVCSLKASVFEAAATARDNNGTQALARQMAAAYKEVSSSYRENAIRQVFENPKFGLPSRTLYQAVLNQCIYSISKSTN